MAYLFYNDLVKKKLEKVKDFPSLFGLLGGMVDTTDLKSVSSLIVGSSPIVSILNYQSLVRESVKIFCPMGLIPKIPCANDAMDSTNASKLIKNQCFTPSTWVSLNKLK